MALALLPPGRAAASQATGPAAPPTLGCQRFPFGLEVDLDAVQALALTPPAALLDAIGRLGIDVLRVVPGAEGPAPRHRNALLAPLPVAPAALLEQAGMRDTYQGRAIPRASPCCALARDTVLIREDASTYTLLHEVVHLMIVPADGQAFRHEVEQRFDPALRRLQVYQRSLNSDPWRLLQPLWRRDILAAQRDVAELLYDRIRIGQSQEAVVERVLRSCITDGSPYFDAARREQGRGYAVAMIDNAVDVFNALHGSLEFCGRAVQDLREEIARGALKPQGPERLDPADADGFAAETRAIRSTLQATREAIEALKRLYAEQIGAPGA